MTTVAEDGKRRKMTSLPLRKLPGWLISIHPNKVNPQLGAKVIAFQDECDDVLWAHWRQKHARPASPAPTPTRDRFLVTVENGRAISTEYVDDTQQIIDTARLDAIGQALDAATEALHHLRGEMAPKSFARQILDALPEPRNPLIPTRCRG